MKNVDKIKISIIKEPASVYIYSDATFISLNVLNTKYYYDNLFI
jgi:hypothetical protein